MQGTPAWAPGRRWRAFATAAAVGAALSACASQTNETVVRLPTVSPLSPEARRAALRELPHPLSESDAAAYRRAFQHQSRGEFAEADRLLRGVSDKSLVGHALAQRYLGGAYKPGFKELADWMDNYGDHADAERIYRMAAGLRGRGGGPLREPQRLARAPFAAPAGSPPPNANDGANPERPPDSGARAAGGLRAQIAAAVRRGAHSVAEGLLNSRGDALLGPARADALRADIALGYFQNGEHERAYALAARAAQRSARFAPQAAWVAGLTGWRLGKHKEAAAYFETYAGFRHESEWTTAAAAYWAGRAHDAANNREAGTRWYERASQFGRTLHGMLARHKLNKPQAFDFSHAPSATRSDFERLANKAPVKRAFALIQIGQAAPAGEELMRQYFADGEASPELYLAIADKGAVPQLAYLVSGRLYARTSRLHDVSLYPVPDWRPNGGLTVDRALVLAVMRQESAYQHNVVSRAGARGLMQLMPATAAMVANDRSLRGGEVNRLFEPEFNIELGQRFLRQLIERDNIRGNLMFVAASYNAGEGALARWRMRDDPLPFIAAIPYRETRDYVHRVMYNMAAYSIRFNQGTSELDQMVRGQWPTYRAVDGQNAAGGRETLR